MSASSAKFNFNGTSTATTTTAVLVLSADMTEIYINHINSNYNNSDPRGEYRNSDSSCAS